MDRSKKKDVLTLRFFNLSLLNGMDTNHVKPQISKQSNAIISPLREVEKNALTTINVNPSWSNRLYRILSFLVVYGIARTSPSKQSIAKELLSTLSDVPKG